MRIRNRAIWFGFAGPLALAAGLAAQPQPRPAPQRPLATRYSVEKPDDSMFGILRAAVGGRTYTLIGKSKEMCLAIVDQRDWEGNGSRSALVERIAACGGDCCPNSFFFVSARPDGHFAIGEDLADSWAEPIVERWRNQWSVVIVSNNEGSNTDRPVEIARRFVLQDGKGVKVEESRRKDIESLMEMRSEIFHGDGEEHSIQYDLDGDGRKDTIGARLWERWGRMIWTVRFANGKEFTSSGAAACKRIGVLSTKTGGVSDLVCDQDTVLRWSGHDYR
jgi:hypothetical protein